MSLDIREDGYDLHSFYGISSEDVPPTGGNVVINISSDNTDVTVDPATLTFDSLLLPWGGYRWSR